MLVEEACRLAFLEVIRLHEDRVTSAIENTRRLRSELEEAESNQRRMIKARDEFLQAVHHG